MGYCLVCAENVVDEDQRRTCGVSARRFAGRITRLRWHHHEDLAADTLADESFHRALVEELPARVGGQGRERIEPWGVVGPRRVERRGRCGVRPLDALNLE